MRLEKKIELFAVVCPLCVDEVCDIFLMDFAGWEQFEKERKKIVFLTEQKRVFFEWHFFALRSGEIKKRRFFIGVFELGFLSSVFLGRIFD
ncbi:MAG: hypothetical protein PHT07_10065 [Paludibacter sp.]|nr:hypothetical protein [Paludibacter sp.]